MDRVVPQSGRYSSDHASSLETVKERGMERESETEGGIEDGQWKLKRRSHRCGQPLSHAPRQIPLPLPILLVLLLLRAE